MKCHTLSFAFFVRTFSAFFVGIIFGVFISSFLFQNQTFKLKKVTNNENHSTNDSKLNIPLALKVFQPTHQPELWEQTKLDDDDAINITTSTITTTTTSRRRIFLDCGANVGSSVELFRATYPDGDAFEIFSFELDASLRPYFSSFRRHHLFCPVAVSDVPGNVTSYVEAHWTPRKGLQDGKDMHWGGGTLFPFESEKDSLSGGQRRLATRANVTSIDLAHWILHNTDDDDDVILKLDVEGAELKVLCRLLETGAAKRVDKWYGEFHEWAPNQARADDWQRLYGDLEAAGIHLHKWEAEKGFFEDMEVMNLPSARAVDAPGQPGELLSSCRRKRDRQKTVSVGVAVGMNPITAEKLVATLKSFLDVEEPSPSSVPLITLFLHSDFVQLNPHLVSQWSQFFLIASRGDRPQPTSHFLAFSLRKSFISASRAFARHNLEPVHVLSESWDVPSVLVTQARRRGLRVVRPTVRFPPTDSRPQQLDELYFQVRSVERTPKALRFIYDGLQPEGGILVLDADFEDTFMISVFLMQFLTETSEFQRVALKDCF